MPVCAFVLCGKEFTPPDARKRFVCSSKCRKAIDRRAVWQRAKANGKHLARRKSLVNTPASIDFICARIDCAKSFTRSPGDKRIGSRKDPAIEYCSVKCRTRVNQRILNGVAAPRREKSVSLPKKAKPTTNQPIKQVITVKCECYGCTTPKNTIDVVVSPNGGGSSNSEKTITRVPSGWTVEVCGEDYAVICDVCMNRIESIDPEAASFRNASAIATQDIDNVVVVDREYDTCSQCARPFVKTHGLMVYCGSQCRKDAAVRIRTEKIRANRAAKGSSSLVKKCSFDGCCKDFETNNPRQKYCSRKCSWRNVWKKQKAITKNVPKGFVDPIMVIVNDNVFYSGAMSQ